ncbi:MAG: response regulator [Phycisphaeraceae bacterium]
MVRSDSKTTARPARKARPKPKTITGSPAATGASGASGGKPFRVLVVDSDASVKQALEQCFLPGDLSVDWVPGIGPAQAALTQGGVDLALIAVQQADGSGLGLARELAHQRKPTPSVMLVSQASVQDLVQIMRAGALDVLSKPLDANELSQRLDSVMRRLRSQQRTTNRVRRLRRMCLRLNQAREEISEQVNVLCTDLVSAYQELASQMQQVIQSSEINAVIRNELDLEQLVRKVLEFVLDKAGPTNAAMFLPSSSDEYSLGGYVNFDGASGPSEILLQEMADHLAPRVAGEDTPVHIIDDVDLSAWLEEHCEYLRGQHVLAMPCRHGDEVLAVLTLFREADQPFDENTLETIAAIGPLLGDALAKVIRVHHRCLFNEDEPESSF